LGHTRLLLDGAGNVVNRYAYDAWGNLIEYEEAVPNPFTWNGAYGYEYIPLTGLYHVGAREYDPRTARWLQRDPIEASSGDPNFWRYCGNDPLNHLDSDGLALVGIRERSESFFALEYVAADLVSTGGAGLTTRLGLRLLGPSLKRAANAAGRFLGKTLSRIRWPWSKSPKPLKPCERNLLTVDYPSSQFPESARHIQDAQKAGHPDTITVHRPGAGKRRQDAMKGHSSIEGKDRDEYPPAISSEGGKGASVRYISPSDNRGGGAFLGNALRDVPDGTKVRIRIVP
jgi:RHS repeat-associated protein